MSSVAMSEMYQNPSQYDHLVDSYTALVAATASDEVL
jgi:hypothetical protein